jgi:uncharacterized membrane protein
MARQDEEPAAVAGLRPPGPGPQAGERPAAGAGEQPGGEAPGAGDITRADPAAWLIALLAFAAYTTLSVLRYLRLDPGSWDLGIFTSYVRQIAHLRPPVVPIRGAGFNLLGDHFQPIVGLIAPFFRLFPTPVTLLVAQALLTAVSVVPVCRAARVRLGTGASRVIGVAYGFSWGLAEMVNFDFHEVAFAVPLLAFSLSALVRRRPGAGVAWALPLVFVKEDQGFTLAAIGLVMLAAAAAARQGAAASGPGAEPGLAAGTTPAAWAWGGALLTVWGLAWSMFAIMVIVPHFNPAHAYPYWYDGGVAEPGGHPSLAALAHQLTQGGPEKLQTTVMILLPVAFLALRSPLALVAVPSLALRFLSTNNYFWGTGWHYNATVMPILFLAAVDGLARFGARSAARARAAGRGQGEAGPGPAGSARPRRPARPGMALARYGAYLMLPLGVWLAFRHPLANLWQPQTYQISPHVAADRAAMAHVPSNTTVETTLNMLAPLAARDVTSWVGTTGIPAPRYIVFDNDNSGWSPPPGDVLSFVEQRHPGVLYHQIFFDDNVYVFRSSGPTGG